MNVVYGPRAPVPIFQHDEEFSQLLHLYREQNPLSVLEIGTYHGGTLYHWLQNAPAGALVVSVDTYTAADNRHLYGGWTPPGVALQVIQGDSRDPETIEQASALGPFDWIFIDADHYYEAVADDWRNYGPMCVEGGIVCFHDILDDRVHHPEIQVAELWREIEREHETMEIVADRAAYWGGIGVVFMP